MTAAGGISTSIDRDPATHIANTRTHNDYLRTRANESMVSIETCRRDIRALHAFFVDWYADKADREAFGDFERALGEGFEMITPDGERLDREAVLAMVADGRGRYDPGEFDIEIRDVSVVASFEDRTLTRYEEIQTGPTGREIRISTVLLAPGPERSVLPGGQPIEWQYLQETWLGG